MDCRLSAKCPQRKLNARPEYQQPFLIGHCKKLFPIIRNDTRPAARDGELPPSINALNTMLMLELVYCGEWH